MNFYFDSYYIYISLSLIGLLLGFFLKGRWEILTIFYLSIIFGFREGFGNDYDQYINIFKVIGEYQTSLHIEPGAYFINYFSFEIFGTDGYYSVFFIYSFLTWFFVYKALKYYGCEKYLVVVIMLTGFVFYANNAIRQALAISFLMYNYKYLYINKRKYIFNTILSVFLFHYSTLTYLILLFIPNKTYKRSVYFLILILSYILYVTGYVQPIFNYVVKFVPVYGDIYLSRIDNFKISYQGSGLVIIFWYLYITVVIFHKEKINGNLFNSFVLGSLILLSGINFEMWERLFNPFFYLNVIVMAILIKTTMFRNRFNLVISSTLVVCLFLLTSVQILENKNKNKIVPFNHLFIEEEIH